MEKRLEAGGRSWRMKYTVNSMCQMEDRAGGEIENAFQGTYRAARLLFWGAVIELQPEVTLEEAGRAVEAFLREGGTLAEMIDICAECLKLAGFIGESV